MKERPILFQGAMVRALLDGSKTQTRRVYKSRFHPDFGCEMAASELGGEQQHVVDRICPYGQPGDHLWVRETFQPLFADGREYGSDTPNWKTGEGYTVTYPATDPIVEWIDGDDNITSRCKPSIHMPRWASRITLEIVSVRVERLSDCSSADAIAEGVDWKACPAHQAQASVEAQSIARKIGMAAHYEAAIDYVGGYQRLWESINGAGSWAANPWVWVVEFKRVTP